MDVIKDIGTVNGTIVAPTFLAGSWLWNNLGPAWSFRASAISGLIAVSIFWLGVKEPPRKRCMEEIVSE